MQLLNQHERPFINGDDSMGPEEEQDIIDEDLFTNWHSMISMKGMEEREDISNFKISSEFDADTGEITWLTEFPYFTTQIKNSPQYLLKQCEDLFYSDHKLETKLEFLS